MALVSLVNKPQVLECIVRWLLFFLEYEFIMFYKLGCTHVVANALFWLPNSTKPMGVLDQSCGWNILPYATSVVELHKIVFANWTDAKKLIHS